MRERRREVWRGVPVSGDVEVAGGLVVRLQAAVLDAVHDGVVQDAAAADGGGSGGLAVGRSRSSGRRRSRSSNC